jgi:hypothetical protein
VNQYQKYFVQNMFPSLHNAKKHFARQKTAIQFSLPIDNSMCHNGHQVVDELRRLKILRAPHPPYSPDISPCDFWMFGDFKHKLKDRHRQGPEEILRAFQESWDSMTFEELQMAFEPWRNRLRWITERDREHFRECHSYKSAISWTTKNWGTFSLLSGHPVCDFGLLARFAISQRTSEGCPGSFPPGIFALTSPGFYFLFHWEIRLLRQELLASLRSSLLVWRFNRSRTNEQKS